MRRSRPTAGSRSRRRRGTSRWWPWPTPGPSSSAGAISAAMARIRLQPWARVSGTVMLDGKPAANLGLSSFDPDESRPIPGEPRIEHRSYVETDADGRFELRRVMPGRLVLGRHGAQRRAPTGSGPWTWRRVDVESGKTYDLKIGRSGRRVAGRLQVPRFRRLDGPQGGDRREVLGREDARHRSASTSPMTAASVPWICRPAITSCGSRSTSPRRTTPAAGAG